MIRTKSRLRLCTILLVLNIAFIWGNSLLPGEASAAFSQWVKNVLTGIGLHFGDSQGGHGLLRKLAHFTEFACLGMCLTWLFAMLGKRSWLPLLCGFLVACTDEIIQCFVPDRGPAVRDVMIDTAGVCLGIVLLLTGYTINRKRKNFGGNEKMKKLIALLLALTMVAAMTAGCANDNANDDTTEGTTTEATTEATTEETTEAPVEDTTDGAAVPATNGAVEILTNVWNLFGEDEKFFVFGGDGLNMVDGAPGVYTDMEALTTQLVVPADQFENITEIGSLFHGMMLNNFSSGAFKMAEGVDAAAFADTLHDAVANNQWMCGIPEKMMIAVVDGEYVVLAFGLNDVIGTFEAKLAEAYPEAEVKYSEAIAG